MLCFFSDRIHDLSKIVKTVQNKEKRTNGPSNPVSRGVAELRKLGLKEQMEYLGCALRMHKLQDRQVFDRNSLEGYLKLLPYM